MKLVKRPSVVADGAGNVYVAFAAESGKVGNISVGGQSVLVQLDPAGKVSAVETFGDSVTTPVALAIEPGGEDVYLLGDSWDNEVKFGPKITLSFSHRHDVFVAKYAPSFIGTADGPWRWARPMGGQDGDVAHAGDMLVTQGGKIVVAGAYAYPIKCGGLSPEFMPDGNDLRIALLEPHTGGCIWAYSFGSTGSTGQQTIQYLRMRHEPGGKNLILSGLYEGAELFKKGNGGLSLPPSTYNDIFVAKLDDKLEPTWVRGFGAENLDVLYGLAVDSGGSIRLAGVGRGVDFGCGAASDEEGNFFITRLSP